MEIVKGSELQLRIEDLSSEGKGVSRTGEGFVIFSSGTLPGDLATVKIRKKKSSYAEAELVELIESSPFRVQAKCSHFGVCGGCRIQDLAYSRQLEHKTGVVRNAIQRIGGFENVHVPEALASPEIFHYRNKMEFSFSDDVWRDDPSVLSGKRFALGLHVPGFHSKIVDIDECYLQSEISNRILGFTRQFFLERSIDSYTTKTHTGLLRFLIIRQSKRTGELMVNLVTNEHRTQLMNEYTTELVRKFPGINTVVNGITNRKSQTAFADEIHVLSGSGKITETLSTAEGRQLSFEISPNSFFQTNVLQCENLFRTAVDFAELTSDDRVLDLYCGTGTISFFLAERSKEVTGVELVEDSIKDAIKNAGRNGVSNCTFIASDIKDYLEESAHAGKFTVAVLDPPRSGLHPRICELLSESEFRRIVYVSCNPHTQARDLQLICSKGKYAIEKVRPVDMFPHTLHVENVVSLIHV